MSAHKVAYGFLVAVAATSAWSSFPRATLGDCFMHPPVRGAPRPSTNFMKRDGRAVGVEPTNRLELYTVEIEIGTPPQKTFVSVDTGSSELWVNPNCSSISEELGQRELCEQAPFFNVFKSSKELDVVQTIGYGSVGEDLTGVVLNMYLDTVVFGNAKVVSQRLGVPSQAGGLLAGIMGVEGWAINKSYPLLLDSLSLQKVINSRAYSLGLGFMNNSAGSLLFGGIDTKFTGDLAPLPIINSVDGKAHLTINYKSLNVKSSNGSKSFDVKGTNVIVDSRNTFTKLEALLTKQTWDFVGAVLNKDLGFPIVNCSGKEWTGGFTFGFQGANVTVSFRDMIYEPEGICAFGILKTVGGYQQILGDTFMRSEYAVFDLDNKNIHFAQYPNCGSKIIAIGSSKDAVPSVTGSCGSNSTGEPAATVISGTLSSISIDRPNIGAVNRNSSLAGLAVSLFIFCLLY